MEKIDMNRVLAEDYDVRVGNKYEISPGNWGTMVAPTGAVNERVESLGDDASPRDLVPVVLSGLSDYDPKDAIFGMEVAVARDFFRLLSKMSMKVLPELDQSLQPQKKKE